MTKKASKVEKRALLSFLEGYKKSMKGLKKKTGKDYLIRHQKNLFVSKMSHVICGKPTL